MDSESRSDDTEGVTAAGRRRLGAGVSSDTSAAIARLPPASTKDDLSWREMDLMAPWAESCAWPTSQ